MGRSQIGSLFLRPASFTVRQGSSQLTSTASPDKGTTTVNIDSFSLQGPEGS